MTLYVLYETWLNNSILNSEILPNYESIFHCDRLGRIGGGVLVAVKTGIQITRRHDLEPDCERVRRTLC